MLQQTSLLAYASLERVGRKQMACYNVIRARKTACNFDIAKALNWQINRVTPRVKELRQMGFVRESHRDIHPETHRTVIYWEICDEQKGI